MNILHYCLGFPPFRRGGMIKYCVDLMHCQMEQGHNVGMLWPGKYIDERAFCKIKKRKAVDGIKSFELINPLPVPLLDGIVNPQLFTVVKDKAVFRDFIKKEGIEIIHIHTLMGLPREVVDAANEAGVTTVFTSHDYFGVCPNGSFMQGAQLCENDHNCKDCVICCHNGLSIKKIKFLQSKLYRTIKNFCIVKWLRKYHLKRHGNVAVNSDSYFNSVTVTDEERNNYLLLREFYCNILEKIRKLHFNSTQSYEVYKRFVDVDGKSFTITISNSSITDNRKNKDINNIIKIGYLGPISDTRKGFSELFRTLIELFEQGYVNFELHIYNHFLSEYSFLKSHKPYSSKELNDVMKSIDVVVVPSIWYETFGFTVLEAMSYGVPVIVSNHGGAKDLIINGITGIIYNQDNKELKCVIKEILDAPQLLITFNKNILQLPFIKTMNFHANEILNLYKDFN